jgi:hypothetical protein
MSEYVSLVNLEVNGQSITDFQTVEEGEFELARQVKLMNKTGSCNIYPRHSVKVEYVIPSDAPEFDWTTVQNGTLTIDYLSGTRVTYMGVNIGKMGAAKHDGEKESTRSIDLICEQRLEEAASGAGGFGVGGFGAGGFGQ